MAMKTLEDALYDEMRDALSAEKQLTKALPKMVKKANDEKLRTAFEDHLEETRGHVERVEKAIEAMGKSARAKHCAAMEGILKEGEEIMEQDAEPHVKDAFLIAAAQKVEHYEMATYGTLCTWAKQAGQDEALKLLKQNLEEEEKADKKLSKLAESGINAQAAS